MIRTAFWFLAWAESIVLMVWASGKDPFAFVSALVISAICCLYGIKSFLHMSRSP